jgi:antitoxin component YwqK of YwqJK toxin-antitoxin module
MHLASVNLIDQNGFNETITNKDRLSAYERMDFESPQPYQKVLQIYERDGEGDVQSRVTSYHPNGQLHQSLEVVNGRARGRYQEWHENGAVRLEANVISGSADIDPASVRNYVFDGISRVWDESGHPLAEIPYVKGRLEGESLYYHPSGALSSRTPYLRGMRHGKSESWDEVGNLLSYVVYEVDAPNGEATGYWSSDQIAYQENYENGLLFAGDYFDVDGNIVAQVVNGSGLQAMALEDGSQRLIEYRQGMAEGQVKEYAKNGELQRLYHIRDGKRDGEEIEYFPSGPFEMLPPEEMKPKISIEWRRGEINGIVRTWYKGGRLESQREMLSNKKNGTSSAWYSDGSLMLMEEYLEDRLVRGEYFEKGASRSTSRVAQGKGVATLFDSDGRLLRKVNYLDGNPLLS